LLHRSFDLLAPGGEALYRELRAQRQRGIVDQIGVSVYEPEELEALCSRFEFDLIQAPFNVVDRRLAESGWLARLQRQGTEVHVRSVFLQGLLLMHADERPARFAAWQSLWDTWQRWLAESGLTALQACLAFALSHAGIARIVVGVDREAQLAEILASVTKYDVQPPAALASCDSQLINPLSWIQP
jgi:aryl-alcohol dehydrogenase-like predicted oxidoreductase